MRSRKLLAVLSALTLLTATVAVTPSVGQNPVPRAPETRGKHFHVWYLAPGDICWRKHGSYYTMREAEEVAEALRRRNAGWQVEVRGM